VKRWKSGGTRRSLFVKTVGCQNMGWFEIARCTRSSMTVSPRRVPRTAEIGIRARNCRNDRASCASGAPQGNDKTNLTIRRWNAQRPLAYSSVGTVQRMGGSSPY